MIGRHLAELRGLFRSIRVYHGDRNHHRAMDGLYRDFIGPGGLAFDIGAHVGDRVRSFRRLGARVVAVEPQAGPMGVMKLLFGRDPDITLIRSAVADRVGQLTLHVNSRNPTVTTASAEFPKAAERADGWQGQQWDRVVEVPATTLDALIEAHGLPDFVKIDVEGFEDVVLAGLSRPVPALSFEFTTIQRDVALRALDRIVARGSYRFDYSLGETHRLVFGRWVEAAEMAAEIMALPDSANSGDVYAQLVSG